MADETSRKVSKGLLRFLCLRISHTHEYAWTYVFDRYTTYLERVRETATCPSNLQ